MLLQVQASIDTSSEEMCNAFWDLKKFHKIWDPITQFDILYDDRFHQECLLQVERNHQREQIRIFRFRCENSILFFNTQPPPMMHKHQGAWWIRSLSKSTCLVQAEREYTLLQSPDENASEFKRRAEEFQLIFQARLTRLLHCFQLHFQASSL
jgi:hypothetical protein